MSTASVPINKMFAKVCRPTRLILSICAAASLAGCHESGTWSDDNKNWKRIFRVAKPSDITVVHSQFWRSPHFTYEFRYFLWVRKHEDFQKRLLTLNTMKKVSEERELQEVAAWPEDKPAWFVPKPIAGYDVWIYSNAPDSHFRLLIDRETSDLFLCDYQL
jgi:hypothetical protein